MPNVLNILSAAIFYGGGGAVATWILVLIGRWITRRRLNGTRFKGQRVVITGASSGMGAEMARQYARMGASVVLAARRVDRLNDVVQECRLLQAKNASGGTGFHPEVVAVEADVGVEEDCGHLIDSAIDALGGIDILVLNAGIGCSRKFEEIADFEEHHRTMQVNYWGCVYTTHAALPHLRKSKGKILVVSSLAGKIATPLRSGYASTKHALHGFFECLRFEVSPDVSITMACPGYVITEIHNRQLNETGMVRNTSAFMTAEEASRQMIEACLNGDRELIMTLKARVGVLARVFLPYFILDRMVASASTSAFKKA